jgi:hypothetical protein
MAASVAVVAAKVKVTGGKAAEAIIKSIGDKLSKRYVRVGFLETAKYPGARTRGSGKKRKTVQVPVIPVAQVAFWQNFGTKTTPPRPFFNNMVAKSSPRWGKAVGQILKANGYDEGATLASMGELLQGQLMQEIIDTNSPPNAPRTVEMKNGATKVLVDSGVMLGSVSPGKVAFEVKEGVSE